MLTPPRTAVLAVLCCFPAASVALQPVPLADRVEQALLPSGITNLPVELSGSRVYVFKDEGGTDTLHFIGDFALSLGDERIQKLKSKEAVAWIENRGFEQKPYRYLQLLLWGDAEVDEIGGTRTSGPVLFVTLSTFGEIATHADDVALQSSSDTQVYRQANTIRQSLASGKSPDTDQRTSLGVFDPTGLSRETQQPRPRPVMHFESKGEVATFEPAEGRQVVTMVGGVYLARGTAGTGEFMEIQSDSVVIFLAQGQGLPTGTDLSTAGLGGKPPPNPEKSAPQAGDTDRQLLSTGLGNLEVEAAYLEGDVQLSQGPNTIRAARLYYDFLEDRALILDAVVRTMLEQRGVPLYIRAAEIRQLSVSEFSADDAMLTTSEFHTPHYHVGARHIDLVNRTPREPDGRAGAIRAGSFRIEDATLNVGGHPIAFWPYVRGNVDTSETAIRGMRTGFSDDFGFELETKWGLFNVLGLQTPPGFDSTLNLDYFSERGPAIGIDANYEREKYFGLLRSYLMTDHGEDNLGEDREEVSPHDVRGRLLVRHRQYLEDDWQLSLELSYLSDKSFLEEFFETEFDTGKEQETLLYLKKQRDNWAFTAALQARILDFYTQTERLPDFSLHLVGESLPGGAVWYSENRAGIVRYRDADQTFRELLRDGRTIGSGSTPRADTRQELDMPIDIGPVRFVPFAAGRGTAWDDSPHDGGLARGFGIVGVRGSSYFTRVYPQTRSSMFDVDGIRHIIKPDITAWTAESNRDKEDLFPFDETVEEIAATDGVTVGVRQRWQTKRGAAENRHTVDVVTLDLELAAFNDSESDETTNGYTSSSRPENSISHNYFNTSFVWRINDRTALLNESNYDVNDGQFDIMNVSLAVERTPRLSYLIGYRFIDETESNLLGLDINYRLTEKHTLAVRELFDLDRGDTLDFTIAFVRRFPRWFTALSFQLDEAEDDYGISLSLWPEGLPQAAFGSRRFTGLTGPPQLHNE